MINLLFKGKKSNYSKNKKKVILLKIYYLLFNILFFTPLIHVSFDYFNILFIAQSC